MGFVLYVKNRFKFVEILVEVPNTLVLLPYWLLTLLEQDISVIYVAIDLKVSKQLTYYLKHTTQCSTKEEKESEHFFSVEAAAAGSDITMFENLEI